MNKFDPAHVQWIITWVPIIAGLLGLLYGLLAALLPTRDGVPADSLRSPAQRTLAVRQFRCSIILIVIGVLAWWLLGRPVETRLSMAWAFLIAGVFGLVVSVLGDTRRAKNFRQAAGSGLAATSLALLAVGVPRWFSGEYPNEVALAVCFGALVPTLVYWLSTTISEAAPASASSMLYLLMVMGIVVSSGLGRGHFTQNPVGAGYGLLLISVAVVVSVAVLAVAGPAGSSGVSRLRVNLAALSVGIICGVIDYLLKIALFPEANAFYSVAIGLGCGTVVLWLSQFGGTREPVVGPSAETALVIILLLVGATALGFRLIAGYGAGLVALGVLSLLALAPLCERSTGRMGAQLMLSASTWFVLAPWWRWFTSTTSLVRVDLDRAFVFLGLGLGVAAPLLLSALCGQPPSSGRGNWRAVLMMFLVAVLPLAVAFFWLLDGLAGFMPGIVTAQLVVVLLIWLRGERDVEWLCAPPVGAALMLVGMRFGPGMRSLSAELGRIQKIEVLAILVVIAAIILAVSSLFSRGRARRG